jgi:ubiquitin C-terminal hydrolase
MNNMNVVNKNMAQNTLQTFQANGVNLNQNINLNNNNNQLNNNNNTVKLSPHKVGLQNLGQTCYMNSSLQCLSNIDIFTKELLNNCQKINPNTQQFAFAYTRLLSQLKYPKENCKYLDPSNFKTILGKFNPLFEGNNASDAKDLILFILQRLHLELKNQQNKNLKGQMNFNLQEQISLNENLSLQNFLNDFNSTQSCVSETFHGIYKIQLKCDGCQKIKYSYQTFNMLTFILKKIKDDKLSSLGQQYYKGINFNDAFYTDKKEEILKDENMIFCNSCQGTHTGSTQQSIFSLPPILIIVLNRGKNNQDFNEEFNFPEVLDFNDGNNFVISNYNNYKRFFLCGIITHLGESSSSGHFICYCRNDLNDPFVCYNDTQVAEGIEIDIAMRCNLSENSYEKKTPYILFYHYF